MAGQDSSFDKNAELQLKRVMFSPNEEINAYLFYLVQNGKYWGYIIANNDSFNHIVEYGKELFLDEAADDAEINYNLDKSKQKVYYLGGLDYVISGKDLYGNSYYVDTAGGKCAEIKREHLNSIYKENRQSSSTPKTPDKEGEGFITDPDLYEKGYDEFRSKDVINYNLTYWTMDQFRSGGVCTPTAATNLLYYWYNRGPKYKKLLSYSWENVFYYLYTFMQTNVGVKGTYDHMAATGYTKYLNLQGYNCKVTYHSGTDYGKKLIPEINANRPCHLFLHDHYMYGDHSVVALGYKQYVYYHWYGDNHETYIRIADGWTKTPNRYVWGSCKGNWNYTTVEIK